MYSPLASLAARLLAAAKPRLAAGAISRAAGKRAAIAAGEPSLEALSTTMISIVAGGACFTTVSRHASVIAAVL